jgi:hypothetical protein
MFQAACESRFNWLYLTVTGNGCNVIRIWIIQAKNCPKRLVKEMIKSDPKRMEISGKFL